MTAARKYDFDNLILRMEAHPTLARGVFDTWCKANGLKTSDLESLRKPFGEYVSRQIFDMSDNIPRSPALNNDFFKFWTSDKPKDRLPAEKIRAVLANYRALTDLTRHAVALSYLAAHGDPRAEARAGANLGEESGDGKPEKAHFLYLNQFIASTLEHIRAEPLSLDRIKRSPVILSQTREAMQIEQDLYIGSFITKTGITPTLIIGGHPLNVTAGIQAVSAAHESKAPGMLAMILEGLVKYIGTATTSQKSGIRKYFDEHLGTDVVDRILDGEKISSKLIEENERVKGWSSDRLRAEGYVEQAHRKDANDSTIAIVMSPKTPDGKDVGMFDNVQAFIAAKAGFEIFPKAHGHFWNGVYDGIIASKKVERSPVKAITANDSPKAESGVNRRKSFAASKTRFSSGSDHSESESESESLKSGETTKSEPRQRRKTVFSSNKPDGGFVENFLSQKAAESRGKLRDL